MLILCSESVGVDGIMCRAVLFSLLALPQHIYHACVICLALPVVMPRKVILCTVSHRDVSENLYSLLMSFA